MAKVAVRDEHRLGVFRMIASALVFALSGVLTKAIAADAWTIACWRGLVGGLPMQRMLHGWVETGRQGTPFGSDGKVLSFVRSEISRPFFPPMAASTIWGRQIVNCLLAKLEEHRLSPSRVTE